MSEIEKKPRKKTSPKGYNPDQLRDDMTGNVPSNQKGIMGLRKFETLLDPAMLAQQAGMGQMHTMPENALREGPGTPQPGVMGGQGQGGTELDAGRNLQMQTPMGSRITEDMLVQATRTLHKYKAGKKSVETRIIEAQQWWKLHNWEEITAKTGVEGSRTDKTSTAWLWNCVVGKHADLMDAYPEPAILPRMKDDKEEAANLSDIVPVVMKINGFEQTYSDAGWQKLLEGTGAYGVYWDKDKLNGLGDISITRVNLLNLFFEPGINDIQDSKNVFHVAMMDNDTLRQMYPQLRNAPLDGGETVSKYRYDDTVDTTDKSLVIDWYYHEYNGPRKVLHYVKYVGNTVLYATVDDPVCAQRGLYDDGQYPFVLDPLYPVEGSPCGYGYIQVGKGTQKNIDQLTQAVVSNATLNATPRFFVRKDGQINEQEFADTRNPFVHFSGVLDQTSCVPIVNPQLPGNVLQVEQMLVDELKFVTGNADVNNGGTPAGVTSASGIAALQSTAGRSSRDSNQASYRAYSQLVTMVIERIRQFYDLPRQFRITGARGQERFVSYTNAKLKAQHQGFDFGMDMGYRLPAFDIDVRAQRETSYTKAAQNELAIQLFQLGVFNPQLADQSIMLLDMMDFKGREEIQQKVQEMGTMAQALQQLGMIASQMAMQLGDQQAAAMIQQIAAMASAGGGTAGMQKQMRFSMPEAEATKGNPEQEKHPFVEKAEKQSQEVARPE
jgi:hypothetical protein